MEAPNKLVPPRRPYLTPICERLSVLEVQRRALDAWSGPARGSEPRLRRDRRASPVLLIFGYCGESNLVVAALLATGMYCRSVPAGKGMWMLSTSPFETGTLAKILTQAILLDRRQTNIVRDDALKQVAEDCYTNPVPLAILVGTSFHLESYFGLTPNVCWQLREPADPEVVAKAIRSFLSVWVPVLEGLRYAPKGLAKTNA